MCSVKEMSRLFLLSCRLIFCLKRQLLGIVEGLAFQIETGPEFKVG